MSDDREEVLAEAAERRQEIERKPAPTEARAQALSLLEYAISESLGGDATYKQQAADLARRLGEEIRTGLQREHEDDLERARLRSFTIGVRSALRIARERGSISDVEETNVATALAEQAGIPLDGLGQLLADEVARHDAEAADLEDVVRRFLS